MSINPFNDSNLNDLQKDVSQYLNNHLDGFVLKIKKFFKKVNNKGKERITLMFIPHSEKRIINFHISIFTIVFISIAFLTTITITSVVIVNHSSTIKEVSKLKLNRKNSKLQVKIYKEEINKLYKIFQQFKPEIKYLYSLTPGSQVESLWAKGGVPDPNGVNADGTNSPPIENLNIKEIKEELKTTKKIIVKIKKFLKYRKKIITNTPSIWPVSGYIISRFGTRTSPYSFKKEYHPGIDLESFPGAEIRSTAPGKVTDIQWDPELGLTITIKHKYGFITSYSHLQRVIVKQGQRISRGETIGYIGRTGKTTKYICYYRIKIGTEFVDPMPYLNRISK